MKSKIREWRIPIALGLAALILLLVFVCDYTRRADIGSRTEIGSILFMRNGVQRKFADQVVWSNVDQGEKIANEDTIRTDPRSEVKIRLKDGTVLHLDETSMFQLDLTNNRIDFQGGSLHVESAKDSSLTLQNGDSKVKMGEGDLSLTKNENQDLNVTVHEGKAEVSSNGKSQTVGKNQKAEIGKEGISVKDMPVILLTPSPFQTMAAEGDGTSVAFRYKPQDNIKKPTLEISKDSNFSNPRKIQGGGEGTVALPPGSYYWRVTGEDEAKRPAVSETRKMTIVRGEPLRLQSPDTNEKILFHSNPPDVAFSWSGDSLAASYELEIASDAEFKKIVKSVAVTASSVTVADLPEGQYRWRIRTKPAVQDAPARVSSSASFEVYKTDVMPPDTASPFQSENLTSADAKNGVFFNWKGSPEMKSYAVQVSSDPGFGKSVMNQTTDKNFLMLKGIPDGRYYWRVKGISDGGKSSPYSAVRTFNVGQSYATRIPEKDEKNPNRIRTLSPVRTAVDMTGKKSLDFRWEATPGAKKYSLRIFKNNAGSYEAIHGATVEGTAYSFRDLKSLDIGYFAWDIQAETAAGPMSSGRIDFSIVLNKYLQNLKPGDIHFVNPETIYREEEKQ